MDVLNIIALCMLCTIGVVGVYVVIYIHDIPYEIAKKRNHPHQDAIHMAGWVSLFLLHSIWPFLWIWAYLFKPGSPSLISIEGDFKKVEAIEKELDKVKDELSDLKVILEKQSSAKSLETKDE